MILLAVVTIPLSGTGQTKDYSEDVKSVDHVIAALYDVISGDPGTERDWDRFKNLFVQDARLIPTLKDNEGKTTYRIMSPGDYVQLFASRVSTGFFERELHRVTEEYGAIVHVFSTYETKETKSGPVTNRGINSIQLIKANDRYYVMNIIWSAESHGYPIPEKYQGN